LILIRILRLLHVFSLDVVVAAMAMSAWIFLAHKANLNWPLIFSLGLFVWAVYLFDHALDATRLPLLGTRRQSHFKYRNLFWPIAIFALLSSFAISLPYFLHSSLLGLLFMAAALLLLFCYLGIGLFAPLKPLQQYKEFFLPPGYTLGIALPFVLSQELPSLDFLFLFGIGLLIFQSLLLLAKLDALDDALEKNSTYIQSQNPRQLSILFWACCLLWLGIALFAPNKIGPMFWLGSGTWTIYILFFLNPQILIGWKMRSAIEWLLCLPGLSHAFQSIRH